MRGLLEYVYSINNKTPYK